jgi:hypothetical protein
MQWACDILSSVVCPKYFSTLSDKRYSFFEKIYIEHKISVLIFSTTFFLKLFLILGIIEQTCSKMYIGLHVQYPLFLYYFNET